MGYRECSQCDSASTLEATASTDACELSTKQAACTALDPAASMTFSTHEHPSPALDSTIASRRFDLLCQLRRRQSDWPLGELLVGQVMSPSVKVAPDLSRRAVRRLLDNSPGRPLIVCDQQDCPQGTPHEDHVKAGTSDRQHLRASPQPEAVSWR